MNRLAESQSRQRPQVSTRFGRSFTGLLMFGIRKAGKGKVVFTLSARIGWRFS